MSNTKNNMISNWLEKHGDPEIDRFISKNLDITEKVNAVLHERNLSKTQFAEMLGKKPSEVSRWLTGMHNLTLKSIIKMEIALGVDLIHTVPEIEYHYVHMGIIQGGINEKEPDNAMVYAMVEENEPVSIAN